MLKFKMPSLFRQKAAPSAVYGGGWQNVFAYRGRSHGDHFPGAWQRDIPIDIDQMQRHHAVFACMSQIAGDVAKMRLCLEQLSPAGVWQEAANPAYSGVLAKPNFSQTTGQFLEHWLWSKLSHGNTYILKSRDNRYVVNGLYVLDPYRVRPLVATDGSGAIFYELMADRNTPTLTENIVVPAREIIHDRFNTMHHPLVGMSPLFSATSAAAGGLAMVRSQARFFQRGAQLSGMLIAPGQIDPDTAKRLQQHWETEYGEGVDNAGKIAVLGSGLEFKTMQMSAVDAQLVDQMKWSATQICSAFGMPPWKIALDTWPRGIVNVQALAVDYLSSCLQRYVESIECCLSDGLGLASGLRVCLDESGLLRMDQLSMGEYLGGLVSRGIMSPNEARSRVGLPPVPGGESCFMQQQNWSLAALADPNRGPASGGGAPAPGGKPSE